MDSHRRPVCADGHTRTATDVLCLQTSCVCWRTPTNVLCGHTRTTTNIMCVLTDSHRQPRTSWVCWGTPTDVLCVLNRQPTWAKIAQTSTGRVSVLSPRTNVLICVLMDSHGCPLCADGHTQTHTDSQRPVCSDGQPRTSCVCWRTPTDVLCVLNIQPTWAKITRTVHRKGQHAEFKDQRADMCTDGLPRMSCPRTAMDILCVLADTHRRPVCNEHTAHDQRADMCTDGQPQTSCTAKDVLCVLADTHGCPVQPTWAKITRTVHGKGQRAESKDQRADIQPTWAKITRTVHVKGQRAESKDQRADMCTDGQPQTSSTRTHTNVLCVLTDTHRRPLFVLCVLADTHGLHGKGQRAESKDQLHGKGQRAESKDQRTDMCTDGQPHKCCVC
ncbi:unnamed protein product [Brassica rapa]|uniref:Uncharacterized protein n=1 Tax=Brassica campestris TaxID=3711 RepID=A0A8D9DCS8_BRACM|nr:unnamed protein product [Brassica rapa]